MSWNPFRIVRERFKRATIGGIVDGLNAIEPENDDDFLIEIRVRRLPPLALPSPDLEALDLEALEADAPKVKKK